MVGAVEFFQFLLDGNWLAAVYPIKGKVCGPDSRGGSCYWCLEDLAPGDLVRISLEAGTRHGHSLAQVDSTGPKAVGWQKLRE